MAEEPRAIEKLTGAAKAALLEVITAAARKEGRQPEHIKFLARAIAAVATAGPVMGRST